MPDYNKIDETTLEVAETVEIIRDAKTYTLDALKKQEENLVKKAADFAKMTDAQLVEVRALIAICEDMGIKTAAEVVKAAEPVMPEGE